MTEVAPKKRWADRIPDWWPVAVGAFMGLAFGVQAYGQIGESKTRLDRDEPRLVALETTAATASSKWNDLDERTRRIEDKLDRLMESKR